MEKLLKSILCAAALVTAALVTAAHNARAEGYIEVAGNFHAIGASDWLDAFLIRATADEKLAVIAMTAAAVSPGGNWLGGGLDPLGVSLNMDGRGVGLNTAAMTNRATGGDWLGGGLDPLGMSLNMDGRGVGL